MRWIPPTALSAAVIASLAATASAQEASELTLYRARVLDGGDAAAIGVRRDAHAAVSERRVVTLEAGVNRIRLGRLPATIDPGSLSVRPRDPQGLSVISMRLVGPRARRRSSLAPGAAVTATLDTGQSIEGAVVDTNERFVALRAGGAIQLVWAAAVESIRDSGGGAAIELVAEAREAGRQVLELRYEAGGVSWDVAYTAIREGNVVELSGSLELDNRSGAAFPNAAVAVVDRAHQSISVGIANRDSQIAARIGRSAASAGAGLPIGESERDLGEPIRAPAREVLVFEAGSARPGRFPRASCTSFARPPLSTRSVRAVELPVGAAARSLIPGSVRVVDRGANGRLTPAAEDTLAVDREAGIVRFGVGRSSAINGHWHQRDCRRLGDRRLRETVELEIGNTSARDEVVVVRVSNDRWHHWVIAGESPRGRPWSGGREYRIEIGAGSSRSIHYTAIYDW